jgi:hypothetical protein
MLSATDALVLLRKELFSHFDAGISQVNSALEDVIKHDKSKFCLLILFVV